MVITTAQFHSTKPELRFWSGSNSAGGVSKICDGEDLWQWSRLKRGLNTFRRSTIPQKQFIIFIIINDIEMYSTHNKGKSVVDERFIKTLMCKFYKYMTSISTNMYIDKLDYIVNKYNNIYQSRIKMKLNEACWCQVEHILWL